MGGCLPSCCLWPAHCWAYEYGYTSKFDDPSWTPPKGLDLRSNSTYMAMPDARRDAEGNLLYAESLMRDTVHIHKALAGLGTDDAMVIRIICNRTEEQVQAIGEIFEKQYGVTLESMLEDDLSGDYKKMIMMKVHGQARVDAQVCWDAMKGLGTDEERLNEILTTRHPGQLRAMADEYKTLPANKKHVTVWDHVCDETSFKYERLLRAKLDPAGLMGFMLHEAMHGSRHDVTGLTGIGHDEETMMEIITSINRDNSGVRRVLADFEDHFDNGWKEELERQSHMPDLQQVKHAYKHLWDRGWKVNQKHETLEQSIKESGFSGSGSDFKKYLLQLLKDKGESGAQHLNEAIEQNDKGRIILITTCRNNRDRMRLSAAYKQRYGKTAREALIEGLGKGGLFSGGELSQILQDHYEPLYERWADYLYLAMHGWTDGCGVSKSKADNALESLYRVGMVGGWGTDEERLARTIMFSSKYELTKIQATYDRKFKRKLLVDLCSDTAFNFRRTIMYQFRRSRVGLVHVPRHKLVRCVDMCSQVFSPDGLDTLWQNTARDAAITKWKMKQEANNDEELDVCENMEMDHAALRGPAQISTFETR